MFLKFYMTTVLNEQYSNVYQSIEKAVNVSMCIGIIITVHDLVIRVNDKSFKIHYRHETNKNKIDFYIEFKRVSTRNTSCI